MWYRLNTKFTFGPYVGKTLAEVIKIDKQYINWCITNMPNFEVHGEAFELLYDSRSKRRRRNKANKRKSSTKVTLLFKYKRFNIPIMNTKQLKQETKSAQEWALTHFNATNATDTRLIDDDLDLVPPSFFVEFYDTNKMRITPSIMAVKGFVTIEYTPSVHKSGKVVWRGKHPFYGTPMPELVVKG